MLSEEEIKAIEDLNSFKSISILYGNTFTMFLEQLKKYQQATETVLNLITKLQKENEEKDKEIEKKDKIIDLMSEFLGEKDLGHYKKEDGGEILGIMRIYNKDDWKQYFEELAERKSKEC